MLWLEDTESQWSNLIPIHRLQSTFPLPPSPLPGLLELGVSLSRLLFTFLFHMFCLAFNSLFLLARLTRLPQKKLDMASQAKGLVSFLDPVMVHHSLIVITAETSSSGKFQRWWTHHYWQFPCLYLPKLRCSCSEGKWWLPCWAVEEKKEGVWWRWRVSCKWRFFHKWEENNTEEASWTGRSSDQKNSMYIQDDLNYLSCEWTTLNLLVQFFFFKSVLAEVSCACFVFSWFKEDR